VTQPEVMVELDRLIADARPEDLPRLVGRLVEAEERARLRLRTAAPHAPENGQGEADENLSAVEAARRLGLSRDYLYRHADKLPFTVRIGRRLLFSARGLETWNTRRMGR
jgi:predicted DNA-binding transcriptional regulator AlpA